MRPRWIRKLRDEKAAADAALEEAAFAAEAQMSQGASAPAAAVAARAAPWEQLSIEDSVLRANFSQSAADARDSFRAEKLAEMGKAPIDVVSSDEDFERQGQGAKRSRSSCSSRDVHSRSSGETLFFSPRADGAADKEGEPKQASQTPKKKAKVVSFAKAEAAAKAKARGAKAAAKRNLKALDPEV